MSYGGVAPKTAPQTTTGGYQGIKAPTTAPAPVLVKTDSTAPVDFTQMNLKSGPVFQTPFMQNSDAAVRSVGTQIKDTFTQSFQQSVEGVDKIREGGTPVQGLEAGLQVGAGMAGVIFSEMAPILNGIGAIIQKAGDILSNNKYLNQNDLANADPNDPELRVLNALNNLGGIAMGLLGAKGGEVKPSTFTPEAAKEIAQHPQIIEAAKEVEKAIRATPTHAEYAAKMGYEGIKPDAELPVIQMGAGKRGTFAQPAEENLPTIDYSAAPESTAPVVGPTLHEQLRSTYKDAGSGLLKHEVPETGVPTEADINGAKFPDFGAPAIPAEQAVMERVKAQQELVNSAPKAQRALDHIRTELELSEPGYRYGTGMGSDAQSHGVSSTFPKWIPEELRSKKLFDTVFKGLKDINNLEYPPAKNIRQRRLYDMLLSEVDDMAGIDTKALRARIMSNEREAKTGASGGDNRSTSGSKGGNGGGDSPFRYEPIKQPAPVSRVERAPVPRETPRGTQQAIKPLEGQGAVKTRGVSLGVEAGAIKNALAEHFGDLPEYKTLSMDEQASKAMDFIAKDSKAALAVAMGEKAAPAGVLPESIFVAVEKIATAEGDVATLRDLANSKLAGAATTMGQRIRTYGERDKVSVVGAIAEIQKAREEAITRRQGSVQRAKETIVKDVSARIKKAAPSKQTWSEFVDSVTC